MADTVEQFLADVDRALDAQEPAATPQVAEAMRRELLNRFDGLIEYTTATEWAAAVALCEALAVLGWGERERVDAITHYNGDCWDTYFINANGENRYRKGRWKKKLPSQRNYAKQMPVVMGVIGGKDSDAAGTNRGELAVVLQRTLRPNEYGDGLEKLYMTLQCQDWNPEPVPAGLQIGSYRAKQQAFSCDLVIAPGYSDLPFEQQRAILADGLRGAVAALRKKLIKKKSAYDIDGLSRDIETAITTWLAS